MAPHVMVGYHTPAAVLGDKETAVAQIINELLVSRSAPLYQKLKYKKQSVTDLWIADDPVANDPKWLLLDSELMLDRFHKDGESYLSDVQQDLIGGLDDLKHFSRQPDAVKTLEVVKSRVRNDLLAGLDSTGSIAEFFAVFYRFSRDTGAIDKSMAAIQSLTPADVDTYARKYFTPNRRVIATMWADQNQKEAK